MAKPIKFSHVLFMTRRFEEMIAWYGNVFEATTMHRDPAIAFRTYDTENHRFAIINLDVTRPEPLAGAVRAESGVNHLSYTYASAGDLLDTYERLRDAGMKPYWSTHHGVSLSLYYTDPDGNRIELQADCFDDASALEFISGEGMAANPIGVDYDPEDLLRRYRNGASEEELLRKPVGPVAAIPAAHGVT